MILRIDARLPGIFLLYRDVLRRGRTATDKDRRELRPRAAGGNPRSDSLRHLFKDLFGHSPPVEHACSHGLIVAGVFRWRLQSRPSSLRAASETIRMTSRSSTPVWREMRRQSSYSGDASTGLPPSSLTFTRAAPSVVWTSRILRSAVTR